MKVFDVGNIKKKSSLKEQIWGILVKTTSKFIKRSQILETTPNNEKVYITTKPFQIFGYSTA